MNKEAKPNKKIWKMPLQWEAICISDIGKVITGTTPSTSNKKYYGGPYKLISPVNLDLGRYVTTAHRMLSKSGLEQCKVLPKHSVLVGCIGNVGKIGMTIDKQSATNQQINAIVCNKSSDSHFIFYALSHSRTKLQSKASKTAVPILKKTAFEKVKIPLPPLPEQKAIAGLLGTWDRAIEKTEELIALKERQFKWLLRKLITDQQNNPTWQKVKLGDVIDYEQPTNYIVKSTKYNNQYKIPVLTAGKSFILGYTNEKTGIFPKNKLPVIIFDDFTTASKLVTFPFKVKSSAMKILLSKKKTNISFLYYSMKNIKFQAKAHKRYWISQYSQIKIPIPSLKEQNRIAKILKTAQKELDLLKELRVKYHEQKKGLMQKLLTGHWRLKL